MCESNSSENEKLEMINRENENLELELYKIKNSKPYILGMKLKKFYEKSFIIKFFYRYRNNLFFSKVLKRIFTSNLLHEEDKGKNLIGVDATEGNSKIALNYNHYKSEIIDFLNEREYKAILFIPEQINHNDFRTKNIIKFMSEQKFLCIECDKSISKIYEKKSDYYVTVKSEEHIHTFIKYKAAIILVNNTSNESYILSYENKVIWADINSIEEINQYNSLYGKFEVIFTSNIHLNSPRPNVIKYECKEDLHNVINYIYSKPIMWKLIANHNIRNTICVKTTTFLNFDGRDYFCGGAERYLLDLYDICKELGYKMVIYQAGNYNWIRYYNDIEIVSAHNGEYNHTIECKNSFTEEFNMRTASGCLLNIFSSFFEVWPYSVNKSIGISHGVAWDGRSVENYDAYKFWNSNKIYIDSAKIVDKMISVDTNTANWFQTIDFNIGNSIEVIHNYVDIEEFFPCKIDRNDEKIIITYPRRLYEPRGLYMVLDIIDNVLEQYNNVEFWFVGKGDSKDTQNVVKKQKKWGERVKWFYCNPKDMHEVYKKTDIALVPTIYSEGTSLSCLEAMASGNGVIATRIGGITDIILNEYNGLLIEPNPKSLHKAIVNLINDRQKLEYIQSKAVETANAFSKKYWKKKWKSAISNYIEQRSEDNNIVSKRVEIWVEDIFNEFLYKVVTKLLSDNYTVFIRSKGKLNIKKISFDRIQFIDYDEVLYSESHMRIVERKLVEDVNEKGEFFVMEEMDI